MARWCRPVKRAPINSFPERVAGYDAATVSAADANMHAEFSGPMPNLPSVVMFAVGHIQHKNSILRANRTREEVTARRDAHFRPSIPMALNAHYNVMAGVALVGAGLIQNKH